jgi:hypothetical protein
MLDYLVVLTCTFLYCPVVSLTVFAKCLPKFAEDAEKFQILCLSKNQNILKLIPV